MSERPKVLTVQRGAQRRGLSRRQFVKLAGAVAAVLGLPKEAWPAFTTALAKSPRLPVLWLEFQDCTGDTESLLRAGERGDALQSGITDPGIVDLLLDVISLEYHETLMAPSGVAAEKSRSDAVSKYKGKYLVVIEGAIPTGANGAYCTIGGRSAMNIAGEVITSARWVLAAGSCAVSGGLPAAFPNPTAAKGVGEVWTNLGNKLINLPGCPANAVNLTAVVCYLIAKGKVPSLRSDKRPEFAYSQTVHDRCPREDYYEDGPRVAKWGDAAHCHGGCLVAMSCRGPRTRANCPTVKWNSGTCWPVLAGHGCIGCTEPKFWDTMFPLYSKPLPVEDD